MQVMTLEGWGDLVSPAPLRHHPTAQTSPKMIHFASLFAPSRVMHMARYCSHAMDAHGIAAMPCSHTGIAAMPYAIACESRVTGPTGASTVAFSVFGAPPMCRSPLRFPSSAIPQPIHH